MTDTTTTTNDTVAITKTVDDTGDVTALIPKTLASAAEIAKALAGTVAYRDKFKGTWQDAFAMILAGLEIGLPPMAAVRVMYTVNGKPAIEARGKMALCLSRGVADYFKRIEDTATAVTWETRRRGSTEVARSRFSMDDAKKAGLTDKPGPWQQYPQRMLSARAAGYLCDDVYPDVCLGLATADADVIDVAANEYRPVPTAAAAPTPTPTAAAAPPPTSAPASSAAPKPTPTPPNEDLITSWIERIALASTKSALEMVWAEIKPHVAGLDQATRERLNKVYTEQRAEIRKSGGDK